ncbi:MAG TPA: PorV/PorQ family protein [Balneolales bacterium]|nr:PorV/PorQ family protein [Balneolales bacterium]
MSFFSYSWALAQEFNSSLPFLNIGPDAYSLSLSEARTAVLTGSSDIYTNPANLALENRSNLDVSYTFWIADTRLSHASVNFKRENDAIAFGILTSTVNNIESRQQPGAAMGTFSDQNFSLAAGYAHTFGPLSIGLNAMYLYEQFYQDNASGYAFTGGATVNLLNSRIRLATTLRNVGKMSPLKETRSKLPRTFTAGFYAKLAQFSTPGQSEIPILIGLSTDYIKPLNEINLNGTTSSNNGLISQTNAFVTSGLSIEIAQLIELRGGYNFSNTTVRKTSFGLGIITNNISADFSYIPFETGYGNVYSLGVKYYF